MIVTATSPNGGEAREHCDSLTVEASDWHDGKDLADLYAAMATPEGMRRLISEARLHNQGKDRWNGLLVPSKN